MLINNRALRPSVISTVRQSAAMRRSKFYQRSSSAANVSKNLRTDYVDYIGLTGGKKTWVGFEKSSASEAGR